MGCGGDRGIWLSHSLSSALYYILVGSSSSADCAGCAGSIPTCAASSIPTAPAVWEALTVMAVYGSSPIPQSQAAPPPSPIQHGTALNLAGSSISAGCEGQLLAKRSVARYVCHAVSVTGSLRSAAQLKAASMIMPNWGKCIALPTRTCGLLSLS